MKKNIEEFDVYNPYTNNEVTEHYLMQITQSLINLGCNIHYIEKISKRKINSSRGIIVISPLDAVKAKKSKYGFIICWTQGIVPEESFMRNHSRLRFFLLSILEKKGLLCSDFIFVVSEQMKMFYERKYKINLKNSFIMPCYNESFPENFDNFEKKYPMSFVYAGGVDAWQCFEDTLALYAEIERKIPESNIYILVKEKEYAKKIALKYGINNYKIDYLPKDKMNSLLQSVKYGFCLRDDVAVNNVATPTKLSTYVCNGIIPIVSDCVKSFVTIYKNSKFAVISNNKKFNLDRLFQQLSLEYTKDELYKDFEALFGSYYCDKNYQIKIQESLSVFFAKELNV